MKIIKMRIDGQQFYLAPDLDLAALKKQLLDSARDVAEFVDFQPIGHGVMSVLMTPQTPVRLEVEERSDEQVAEWEDHPPTSDLSSDYYEETPGTGL